MKTPYRSRFTGEEIDELLSGGIQCSRLSQDEYDAMHKAGTLATHTWYLIYRDYAKTYLMRIYVGKTLIAKRGDRASVGFPYTFPIIFA